MAAVQAHSIPSAAFDAEAGVTAANARVAPSNLASMCEQLEALDFQQIVLGHGQGQPDFQARVIATHFQSAFGESVVPLASGNAKSDTSSMSIAVSVQSLPLTGSMRSQYEPSTFAPSLVNGSSILGSSSAQTSDASLLVQKALLEEEEDGLLVVPQQQQLACSFWFLGCKDTFEDLKVWDTHCQSHLRKKLPSTGWCPFKCEWKRTASSGEEAWRRRFEHIVEVHWDNGHIVDVESRPESDLIRHLWNVKLIDNIQLLDLRQYGRITNNRVFTNTEDGRGSRRRRDRN